MAPVSGLFSKVLAPDMNSQNSISGPFSETFQVFGALTEEWTAFFQNRFGKGFFKTTIATEIYMMLHFNSAVKVTLQLRTILNSG